MSLIASRIGADRAARLSAVAGGLRLSIPAGLVDGRSPKALANRVGDDLAVVLILHFAGSLIYVPVASRRERKVSVNAVARLTLDNLSANDIATRLRCSVRVVYRKRGKARSAGLLAPRIPAE